MKILLVNPGPSGNFGTAMPLGLGYIASYLLSKGKQVEVLDLEVEEYKKLNMPDLIGLYIATTIYPLAIPIIKRLRNDYPSARIVVGGPHPSALPEETLTEVPEVDVVVIGEGEHTMNDIADGKEYSDILGIAYKVHGEIVKSPPRPLITNLDELPFPARHLFPLKKYKIHPPYVSDNFINIITSRGCPYGCSYCFKGIFGKTYRTVSPERVVEEIQTVMRMYGARTIHFYDDDFTLDMNRAEKICDLILKEGIRIRWSCTTRVDLVNYRLLQKMKLAGCYMIAFGVENGSQEMLDAIQKGYTLQQVRDVFKWTKEIGIKTIGFFIIGLPGETEETIAQTIRFCNEIKPNYVSWSIAKLYPKTVLHEIFRQRGAKITPFHLSFSWTNLISENEGTNNPSQTINKYILFAEENFTREQIEKKLVELSTKFYLSPQTMWHEITSITSFSEFVKRGKVGLRLIKLKIFGGRKK